MFCTVLFSLNNILWENSINKKKQFYSWHYYSILYSNIPLLIELRLIFFQLQANLHHTILSVHHFTDVHIYLLDEFP